MTRDVPPYAIVAGNPARVVKYRFDEPTIDMLLRLRWWDLNDHQLNTIVPLLMQAPGPGLIQRLQAMQVHSPTADNTSAGEQSNLVDPAD